MNNIEEIKKVIDTYVTFDTTELMKELKPILAQQREEHKQEVMKVLDELEMDEDNYKRLYDEHRGEVHTENLYYGKWSLAKEINKKIAKIKEEQNE